MTRVWLTDSWLTIREPCLQNPAKIIAADYSWILQPEDPWEVTGYIPQRGFHLRRGSGGGWNCEYLLGRLGHFNVRGRSSRIGSDGPLRGSP